MGPRVKRNFAGYVRGQEQPRPGGRGLARRHGSGPGGAGLGTAIFRRSRRGLQVLLAVAPALPAPGLGLGAAVPDTGCERGHLQLSIAGLLRRAEEAVGSERLGRPAGLRSQAAFADHSVIRVPWAHQIGLFGPACGSGRNLSPWHEATGSSRGGPDLRSARHGPRRSSSGGRGGDPPRGPSGSSDQSTGQPPARPGHAVLHRGFVPRRRGNGVPARPSRRRRKAGGVPVPAIPPSPRYESSVQTA